MADIHGSPGDPGLQMPQAGHPGSAPVPYAGAGQSPEPPLYHAETGPLSDAAADVMSGVVNLGTTQAPYAHDVNAGTADAPYYPGQIDPIFAAGDDDPGGRSDVAGDVAQAVANATARWHNLQGDLGQGAVIGDLIQFPPGPLDPGAGVGNTAPTAAFYDPPRGGAPETFVNAGNEPAPGYQGEAQ